MHEESIFPVPQDWTTQTGIDERKYSELYRASLQNNDEFWSQQAKRITWTKPWTKVKSVSFASPVSIKWFAGAELNVCANCVDRHLPARANQVAFHWVPEDPKAEPVQITYRKLFEAVCQWSAMLNGLGVKKGDRVTTICR